MHKSLMPATPWMARGNTVVDPTGRTVAVVFYPARSGEIARVIAEEITSALDGEAVKPGEVAKLRQEVAALNEDVIKLEDEVERLQSERADLENDVEELESELERLRSKIGAGER
jgi:uncharacterized protein YlxW (UPF0749 family)